MRKIFTSCALLALFCFGPVGLLPAEIQAMEESISGRNYRAIQAAVVELARHNLDISRYRITVTETEASLIVTFIDASAPDDPRGQFRGNPGKIPAFSAELKRDNLQVIRSNFIR